MNKKFLFFGILLSVFTATTAGAEEIDKNTAQMQAMDKITGRVSKINVPVGGEVKFGSLSIVVRSCKTRPEEETPDNFAFADITDKTLQGEIVNIFRGWMISSSPATHAVEHPIYDVWLLKCLDTKVDESLLLSEEALAQRNEILATNVEENKEAENDEKIVKYQPITEMEDVAHEETEPVVDMNTVEFLYDEDGTSEAESEPAEGALKIEITEEETEPETKENVSGSKVLLIDGLIQLQENDQKQ